MSKRTARFVMGLALCGSGAAAGYLSLSYPLFLIVAVVALLSGGVFMSIASH